MSKPTKICPNASLYFVPGLGGNNPDDFVEPFKKIRESIFGVDFKSNEAKILKNRCQYGIYTDVELTTEIKTLTKVHPVCDKYISLVWFCHSYGATMVCQAYNDLKDDLTPQEYLLIFNKSAIICIGGASIAAESLAKVVFNVEFENDDVAQAGSNLYGRRSGKIQQIGPLKDGSCTCCDGSKEAAKNASKGISTRISSSTDPVSNMPSSSASAVLSGSSVDRPVFSANGNKFSLFTCCTTFNLCGELNCCACCPKLSCCACCPGFLRCECCCKPNCRWDKKATEIPRDLVLSTISDQARTITVQPQSVLTRVSTVVLMAAKYVSPQNNETPAHYIGDYILCDNWKMIVRSLLPRPKTKTCKTHCK